MEHEHLTVAGTFIEMQRQGHRIRLDDYLQLVVDLDEHLETIFS